MDLQQSVIIVEREDESGVASTYQQDGIVFGRLASCDVVLNHPTVSRLHAGINNIEGDFYIINLSDANTLTINGRVIGAEQADILAEGDIVQIGPYYLLIERQGTSLKIRLTQSMAGGESTSSSMSGVQASWFMARVDKPRPVARPTADIASVMKVFWDRRTREKAARPSPLHPREKPKPGKARYNWTPTRDLARPWPVSIFMWGTVIVAVLSVAAAFAYARVYSPAPLSDPHQRAQMTKTQFGAIAEKPNANACTTCHTLTGSLDNNCFACHKDAKGFKANTIPPHQDAGITCTSCHTEHKGAAFNPKEASFETCAQCHNDNNKQTYNGRSVHSPHGGKYGYPYENGSWIWKGLDNELLKLRPEILAKKEQTVTEQEWINVQFHAIHLYRVKAVNGITGIKDGVLSCSSCHKETYPKIDRNFPRETCAKCHNGYTENGVSFVAQDKPNCTSCHVQHYYDSYRWGDLLTDQERGARQLNMDKQTVDCVKDSSNPVCKEQ